MKRDIFDLAKPVRDAGLSEIERMLAQDPDVAATIKDGHRLGTHLVAVCIADSSERTGTLGEVIVASYNIHDMFAVAIGQLIGYAGQSFRPVTPDGRPVPVSISGQILMQKVFACAMHQLLNAEQGAVDFNLQFTRKEDGSIEPAAFDFATMMKGPQP